jgi:signal transduction histidine kinase
MHGEIETALLRTAQEALTNVAKHAAAGRVVVTLSYLGDQVALDVRDDGVGFDPAEVAGSPEASGFGLLSMRQRVQRLAGTFEIDSEVGGGTAVSARVPAIGV